MNSFSCRFSFDLFPTPGSARSGRRMQKSLTNSSLSTTRLCTGSRQTSFATSPKSLPICCIQMPWRGAASSISYSTRRRRRLRRVFSSRFCSKRFQSSWAFQSSRCRACDSHGNLKPRWQLTLTHFCLVTGANGGQFSFSAL